MPYVRIIGLQIGLTVVDLSNKNAIYFGYTGTPAEYVVSHSIIKGNLSGTATGCYGIAGTYQTSGSRVAKIYNNIVYDWVNGTNSNTGIRLSLGDGWDFYVSNNTVYGCYTGYLLSSQALVKNCLAQNCNNGFGGTPDPSSDYNCSDISGDAPGANSVIGTVTFVDTANDDYHLDPSDTVAKDAGTDLSSDPNLAFTDDIDGETRSGTWDIGADEYVALAGLSIPVAMHHYQQQMRT